MKWVNRLRLEIIDAIDGVEIMNSPGNPIAQVIVPRSMRSAASKAGAVEETAAEETSTEEAQEAEA